MSKSVKNPKKTLPDNTTQRYLPFSQVRDNMIIMKDNSSRVVLKCSTINFLLKSIEEQDAIIMSFQRFINSINFPVQIMIRSNKLDIESYLNKLEKVAVNQTNPLLQNQTYEYIEYLKKLIEVAQIMRKDFYIVIPQDYEQDNSVRDLTFFWKIKNFWLSINLGNDLIKVKTQLASIQKAKKELSQRTWIVKTSLESIWIKAVELDKNDLVKLLVDYYNPTMEAFTNIKTDTQKYNLI